jgi:hypothetical protein
MQTDDNDGQKIDKMHFGKFKELGIVKVKNQGSKEEKTKVKKTNNLIETFH